MIGPRAVLALAACLAAGGCASAVADEEERVRSTVDAFRLACLREEPVAVLETLTEPQRADFSRAETTLEGCAEVATIDATLEPAIRAALEDAEVAVSVDGDTARATLTTTDALHDGAVELESTGRQWRLHAPEAP